MMYRQLSLFSGGGIADNRNKVNQPDHATIAIGLGGTGIDCLRTFKQHVYDCIQPDDPKAVIPSYSRFGFLAVDAWSCMEHNGQPSNIDQNTEYFDLSVPNLSSFLEWTRALALAGKPAWAWFGNGREAQIPSTVTYGTLGFRRIGRALLMARSQAFLEQLIQLIRDVRSGSATYSPVHIHVFSGMGGGLGSGVFLDVCYLVQYALQIAGGYEDARIFGYGFLPDVALSKLGNARDSAIEQNIKANSYAFMKELDYCMNFDRNQGHWEQQYRGFGISSTQRPVHLCYLISLTVDGRLLEDPEVLMDTVAEHILFGNPIACAHTFMTEPGRYGVLGASVVESPSCEATEYLVARVFDEMAKLGSNEFAEKDVYAFAEANGLTFHALLKSLTTGCNQDLITSQLNELDYRQFLQMEESDLEEPNELQLPEEIMQFYYDYLKVLREKFTINTKQLLRQWQVTPEGQGSSAEPGQIVAALFGMVSDASKGPLYASMFLKGGPTKGLVDFLKGVMREIQMEMWRQEMNVPLRVGDVKRTRASFLHPKIFTMATQTRRRSFNAFICAVAALMDAKCRLAALCELHDLLHTLMVEAERLFDHYFEPYARTVEELTVVFRDNIQYLCAENKTAVKSLGRLFMPMKQLQQYCDQMLGTVNMAGMFAAFHFEFFRMHDVWFFGDENKTRKAVSDWSLKVLAKELNMTFTDFLEQSLQTVDPTILARAFYEHMLKPCYRSCVPCFAMRPQFDWNNIQKYVTCRIPDHVPVVLSAAQELQQAMPEVQLQDGNCPNRVSITCQAYGVSLNDYQLVEECREAYRYCRQRLHIYNGTAKDSRDWRMLPDPI